MVGLEVNAELQRVSVMLHREPGGLAQVHMLSKAYGSSNDRLALLVATAIEGGVITPGATARFRTTGVEIRTYAPQYYATHWLR